MMRVRTTLPVRLLPLLLAFVAACGTTGVSGVVHVGPGFPGQAVVAILIEVPADGSGMRAIGQTAIGTTNQDGGEFRYQFHSLARGTYIVGAYLDADGNRNITPGEPFEWDPNGPLSIEPVDADAMRQTKDLWLAASEPGTGTITGKLFASDRAQQWPILVAAVIRKQDPATLESFLETVRILDMPAKAESTFALHNLPPGDVQLIAIANVGADKEGSNDLFAIGHPTPVLVGRDSVTRDAELWLDLQSARLGSISGTITLNAPAVDLTVELQAFRSDPYNDEGAVAVSLQYVPVSPGATSVEYTIPSLPLGPTYVFATVQTTSGTRVLRGTRSWPTLPGIAAQPIAIEATNLRVTGIDLALGVGRATGTITLRNAPETLKTVAVASFRAGTELEHVALFEGSQSTSVDACAGAPRCFTTTYEMFGLEDRDWLLNVVPDTSGDGWIQDELSQRPPRLYTGSPLIVRIDGGGRAGCDFIVDW